MRARHDRSLLVVLELLLYNILQIYMLFAGWEVHIVKNCDRGLENAARGLRPRAAFSRPRSQFFTIRTDPKPVNNLFIYFFLRTKNCFNFCKHKDKISRKRCRGPWADIEESCQRKQPIRMQDSLPCPLKTK